MAQPWAENSPDLIHRQMEKVIASRTFRTAVAQRKFLHYVVTETVRGRAELLKEYSIGVAVFQKRETFDPRLDSIVRTEAHKLRARLAKYYEIEGKEDELRIEIPIGKYAPLFKSAVTQPASGAQELIAEAVSPAQITPAAVPTLRAENTVDRFEDPGLLFSAGFYPINEFSGRTFEPPAATRSGHSVRIAVLPFMNRSELLSDEFFSDGLTDELTHAFTRVPGLEVVARTSAFQFKGQPVDVRDIGRRLSVDALIEGSVRRSRNRLRILVQLDDAHKGHTLWSEAYERPVEELFELHREIATTVSSELTTHFHGAPAQLPKPGTSGQLIALNPTAYEEFLRGQEFWNRHTIQDFESAAACFERAIKRQASYARAYSSLACCYVMMPILKAILPTEFIPRVESAAARALRLDSFNGEAHIAMALPRIHDCDWRGAEAEFRRGLELCPSSVIGHAWYGTYLVSVGRGEQGLEEQRKVLDLDPISVPALFSYALTLYTLRRYGDAIDHFRKALSLNPGFPREHAGLGLACIRKGSITRGIAELELAQAFTKGLGRVKANLAYAYAVAGHRSKANDILNEFLSDFDPKRFPAAMIAEVYIGLGDKDQAFDWLHKAIDQRDISLFLKADPLYDPLRTDPRFGNLLKRMNLE